MGSRLHGNDDGAAGGALTNDGGRRRTHGRRRRRTHNRHSHNSGNPRPHIVIPATAGIHRHSRDGGNPRRRAGDGFPSPRERRWGGRRRTHKRRRRRTHNRHSHNSGNPRPHNRHSRDGGNPRRRAGDGFPSPRERRWGGRRCTHKRREAAAHPQSSFPQQRESTAHNRHSRDGGNPRRRAGDGFPSPHSQTTVGGGAPTIVIPATAGIHGSSFPRRRESTAEGRRWVPVSTGTTIRNVGKAAATMLN